MEKIGLTKIYKDYYTAKNKPEIVNFGKVPYITISGKGEPSGKEFSEKAGAIYPAAYGIKKICKKSQMDFGVPKLEGLWWVDDKRPALEVPRSEWRWKLLIRMPDFVSEEMVAEAVSAADKKSPFIGSIFYEIINEGDIVSILHTGPYVNEPETIRLMDEFIEQRRLSRNGLHHEIYISDPNKTAPEKLKTILRQPVK